MAETYQSAQDGDATHVIAKPRTLAMTISGVVCLLLALIWAAPILAYLTIQDEMVTETVKMIMQASAFGAKVLVGTVLSGPLPFLALGIALLCKARWSRPVGITWLALHLLDVLVAVHAAMHGIEVEIGAITLINNPSIGYLIAGVTVVIYGALLVVLARIRPARAR